MRLVCVSRFRCTLPDGTQVQYRAGEEIHIGDEIGDYLKRCSPESFVDDAAAGAAEARAQAVAKRAEELGTMPDLGALSLVQLQAYAKTAGIDLDGAETAEDVRAAIQLAFEAVAKAKVETEKAAGTTTHVRPQRKSQAR